MTSLRNGFVERLKTAGCATSVSQRAPLH